MHAAAESHHHTPSSPPLISPTPPAVSSPPPLISPTPPPAVSHSSQRDGKGGKAAASGKGRPLSFSSPLEDRLLDSLTPKRSYAPYIIFGILLVAAGVCAALWFAVPSLKCTLFKIKCKPPTDDCTSKGNACMHNQLCLPVDSPTGKKGCLDAKCINSDSSKCPDYGCPNGFHCDTANCGCVKNTPGPGPDARCSTQDPAMVSLCTLGSNDCTPFSTGSPFYKGFEAKGLHTLIGHNSEGTENCFTDTQVNDVGYSSTGAITNCVSNYDTTGNSHGYNAKLIRPKTTTCAADFQLNGCCKNGTCNDAHWRCRVGANATCYPGATAPPIPTKDGSWQPDDGCCGAGKSGLAGNCCPTEKLMKVTRQDGTPDYACARESEHSVQLDTPVPTSVPCGQQWFDALVDQLLPAKTPNVTQQPNDAWNYYDPLSAASPANPYSIGLVEDIEGRCKLVSGDLGSIKDYDDNDALSFTCSNGLCTVADTTAICQKSVLDATEPVQYLGGGKTPIYKDKTSKKLYWKYDKSLKNELQYTKTSVYKCPKGVEGTCTNLMKEMGEAYESKPAEPGEPEGTVRCESTLVADDSFTGKEVLPEEIAIRCDNSALLEEVDLNNFCENLAPYNKKYITGKTPSKWCFAPDDHSTLAVLNDTDKRPTCDDENPTITSDVEIGPARGLPCVWNGNDGCVANKKLSLLDTGEYCIYGLENGNRQCRANPYSVVETMWEPLGEEGDGVASRSREGLFRVDSREGHAE